MAFQGFTKMNWYGKYIVWKKEKIHELGWNQEPCIPQKGVNFFFASTENRSNDQRSTDQIVYRLGWSRLRSG